MAVSSEDIAAMRVVLDATMAPLQKEFAKAHQAVAKAMAQMSREAEKTNASLAKIGNTIKGTIVGALTGLSVGKLASMTKEAMKWADSLEQQAKWIGLSTNALAAYEDGAKKAGVETGKMGQALEKMVGNLADAAADPNSGPAKIFQQLGLDVKQANADVDAFLGKLADKIQNLSKNDKLIVGKTLFGDRMDDVVRVFEGGAAGLAKMRAEFDKMNPGFADAVKRGAEMNRQYEAIATQIDRDLKQALIDLGPVLLYLVGLTASFARGFSEALKYAGALKDTAANQLARAEGIVNLSKENPGAVPLALRVQAERSIPDLKKKAEAEKYFNNFSGGFVDPSKLPNGKRDFITTGSGASESELAKTLRRVKEEADIARAALTEGPKGEAWRKIEDDLNRLKAGLEEGTQARMDFERRWGDQAALAVKEMQQDQARSVELISAELTGRKDIVYAIQMRQEIEKRFGPEQAALHQATIEQLAQQRARLEETASLMRDVGGELKTAFGDSLSVIVNQNADAAEQLRSIWLNLFNALQKRLIDFALDQAWQAIGSSLKGIGGLSGAHESAHGGDGGGMNLGSIFGFIGQIGGLIGGFFAEGGRPPMGVPSVVGERGPELFIPDTRGTIIPNNKLGGGHTFFVDARGSNDMAATEAAVARGITRAAPHIIGASVERVRDRAFRDPSYLPR